MPLACSSAIIGARSAALTLASALRRPMLRARAADSLPAPPTLVGPIPYPSNSATTASVSLSGLNSPSRASSTIRIATSSTTGNARAPVSRILVRTCSKALCIASIWSGPKNGALRRRPLIASLNLEVPCAARPWCIDCTAMRQIREYCARRARAPHPAHHHEPPQRELTQLGSTSTPAVMSKSDDYRAMALECDDRARTAALVCRR